MLIQPLFVIIESNEGAPGVLVKEVIGDALGILVLEVGPGILVVKYHVYLFEWEVRIWDIIKSLLNEMMVLISFSDRSSELV